MVGAYFLDTSALVKKYMTERGSAWIEALTDYNSHHRIILARVTWVETLSAFSRLGREMRTDPEKLRQSVQVFTSDWKTQFQIVEVEKSDFETAGVLVQKYPLRAYDSLQLACALKIYTVFSVTAPDRFLFVTADDRLINAAEAEGLIVKNPNNYL